MVLALCVILSDVVTNGVVLASMHQLRYCIVGYIRGSNFSWFGPFVV